VRARCTHAIDLAHRTRDAIEAIVGMHRNGGRPHPLQVIMNMLALKESGYDAGTGCVPSTASTRKCPA